MGAASFREMRERQAKEVKGEIEKPISQAQSQDQKQTKRKPRNKKIEP